MSLWEALDLVVRRYAIAEAVAQEDMPKAKILLREYRMAAVLWITPDPGFEDWRKSVGIYS